MNKLELVDKLNSDLTNEYTHMLFYLHSSVMVEGVNRSEISEWLVEHSKSEFEHVQAFAKMIVGLGGTPVSDSHSFPNLTKPVDIFRYAQYLEAQVVKNYAHRMEELEVDLDVLDRDNITLEDRKFVTLFLEDQLLDSRSDLDEINQFIKGN